MRPEDAADAARLTHRDSALATAAMTCLARRIRQPAVVEAAIEAARHSGIPAHLWLIYTGAVSVADYRLALIEARGSHGQPPGVAGAPDLDSPADARARLRFATFGLYQRSPNFSSAHGLWLWQLLALAVPTGLLLGAALILPSSVHLILLIAVALPFFAITVLRVAVLVDTMFADTRRRPPTEPTSVPPWPMYSLLVPLYDEAHVIPGLVEAMEAIDYPGDQIEILLILEASDAATRDAVAATRLGAQFRVIVVPDGRPRTKPKALNYAFALSRGEYIAIFDAEDIPEPGQLKAALAEFRRSKFPLGCVQAVLEIDPGQRGWLAAHFALEYRTLFRGILPALARWRLPIPLGGTSNHFPRQAIEKVGGWDPFNVTEDADLGLRLHRAGYRIATIGSWTLEEAPPRLIIWLKQRTRWQKGFIQTYAVHMREPRALWRELDHDGFAAFQCLVGGQILSALVHPWFYILLAVAWYEGKLLAASSGTLESILFVLAATNLVLGYLSAMLLATAVTIRQRRRLRPTTILTMPFYWLLVSAATYRAVYQFARNPHLWEKTLHAPRPRGTGPKP